jgi:hypothetical protein
MYVCRKSLPAGVINHPCDNWSFDSEGQRVIPNAIIVKPL